MVRIKELQRRYLRTSPNNGKSFRLDQTLGKPGQYQNKAKCHSMTIGARLARVELQVWFLVDITYGLAQYPRPEDGYMHPGNVQSLSTHPTRPRRAPSPAPRPSTQPAHPNDVADRNAPLNHYYAAEVSKLEEAGQDVSLVGHVRQSSA